MSRVIEYYFDFGSPAAYLASTQLPGIANEYGAVLDYKPVLLGGIFQAAKNASPITVPAKGQYMLKDLARYAQRYGVEFRLNPFFPINTLTLMRLAVGVQTHLSDPFPAFVEAIFHAIWVKGLNLGDLEVLRTFLTAQGYDAGTIMAYADEPAVKDRLKEETAQAVKRGLFGVPTMFVGREMFWGQDRLDFVREALSKNG